MITNSFNKHQEIILTYYNDTIETITKTAMAPIYLHIIHPFYIKQYTININIIYSSMTNGIYYHPHCCHCLLLILILLLLLLLLLLMGGEIMIVIITKQLLLFVIEEIVEVVKVVVIIIVLFQHQPHYRRDNWDDEYIYIYFSYLQIGYKRRNSMLLMMLNTEIM